MPASISGGTVASAYVVGTLGQAIQQFTSWFGAGPAPQPPVHPYDFYQVTLTTTSTLNVSIALDGPIVDNDTILLYKGPVAAGLPSGSGLAIMDASDNEVAPIYGAADVYDNAQGTAMLSPVLPAGTYWIKANNPAQGTPGGDTYTIRMSATEAGSQTHDLAGGNPATARVVGTLSATPQVFTDYVGQGDAYDYYAFTVTGNSTVNIQFTAGTPSGVPLATSGIALYGTDGVTPLSSSAVGGTTGVASISQGLAAGTYYLKVDVSDVAGAGTDYQLSLSDSSASGAGTGSVTGGGTSTTVPAGGISQGVGSGGTIRFIDRSPEAQAGRLYQAAFGRAADDAGVAYWSGALHSGASLTSIAGGFLASAEFQARYGSPDNGAFVTALYQNVLHRGPDAAGLAYWQAALESGSSTRAQALVGFSESAENEAGTPPSADAESAARLYLAALGRAPDSAGLTFWTSQLSNGTATLAQEADALAGSPEFIGRYGNLDDAGFVGQLYQNVLGRAADAAGLASWIQALAAGASRGNVVTGFSESTEAQTRFASVAGQNGILVS